MPGRKKEPQDKTVRRKSFKSTASYAREPSERECFAAGLSLLVAVSEPPRKARGSGIKTNKRGSSIKTKKRGSVIKTKKRGSRIKTKKSKTKK